MTVAYASESFNLSPEFSYLIRNNGKQGMEMNGAAKHFMAFGGGMRFCVGTDFTKEQMAVFLNCLVTKYR